MYAIFKVQNQQFPLLNGDEEIRTLDPLLARQVLSQLSYIPLLLLILFDPCNSTQTNVLQWA